MLFEHCAIKSYQQNAKGKRSLKIEDVKKLADQADALGLARFVISGGEPTTFSDLDELVAAIDPKRFFINSDSNGYLLADKAEHMKKIGIDRIQLSIDSLNPDEHDEFRRAGEPVELDHVRPGLRRADTAEKNGQGRPFVFEQVDGARPVRRADVRRLLHGNTIQQISFPAL